MTPTRKLFGREPAAYLAIVRLVLALIVTFGLNHLNADDSAVIYAVVLAAFGVFTVWTTRDKLLAALESLAQSIGVLLIQYSVGITQDQLGILVGLVGAVSALWLRGQTSPTETAVTRA